MGATTADLNTKTLEGAKHQFVLAGRQQIQEAGIGVRDLHHHVHNMS